MNIVLFKITQSKEIVIKLNTIFKLNFLKDKY